MDSHEIKVVHLPPVSPENIKPQTVILTLLGVTQHKFVDVNKAQLHEI